MPAPTLSFCCFGKTRRDTEIVITEVVPNLTPDIDEEELEPKFAQLVDELDLTSANRHAMLSLPFEKKWQIYCSRKNEQPVLSYSPEYYIDRVRAFMAQESPKLFESLKTSLRTETHSFVQRYLELDGLEVLLQHLKNAQLSAAHSAIIACLKSLLNNSTGRAHVLAHTEALNIISQSLAGESNRCKVDVLEILGAVCLVPGGHRRVLEAVSYFQEFAGERTRFQTIICELDRWTGAWKEDIGLKTAIMSFLNAILSYGPGVECTEFRLHLRYELLMLGIAPTIDKLRQLDNLTLDKHLDFFQMMRAEDEKELARRLTTVHVDTTNVEGMFEAIKARWSHSMAFSNLQSIFVHLLLMPAEAHWILLDRVLQQIVLYPNTDRVVLSLDIDDLVRRLATESEFAQLESKLESATAENGAVMKKLLEAEQFLELTQQEKERLQASVHDLTERLSFHQSCHNNAINTSIETGGMTNGSLPSADSPPSPTTRTLPSLSSSLSSIVKPPSASPPALPSFMPPPPPPPPPGMLPLGALAAQTKRPKKPIPSASAPLKSFNWSKLPESKLAGTLWTDIEEEYGMLDLGEVDRLFSAYQKQNGQDPSVGAGEKPTKKLLSVIDSRRAQNCTILLSKLKMSDEDICKAVISMDSRDNLPLDMIEQLLKFKPTLEERSLLEEHQVEELARADTFLLKVSRIVHYEERLFTLHYKRRFNTLTHDLQSKMRSVILSCEEVRGSRKLKKLLQLVLSLGNYMNRGGRGGASGFRLASLTRLADTKSNSKINLLNYVVGQLETNHADLLGIEEEIGHVKSAAKVSLAELEKEMTGLKSGLVQINAEVEFQRRQALVVGDRYLSVAREFLSTAGGKVESLEKLFSEMKWKFSQTVNFFGEDYTQIDEFFSIFDQFLTSFSEARAENESLRRRKEDEGKKQATLRRPSKAQSQPPGSAAAGAEKPAETKGEFDDLISALRTGDVFSDLSDTRKRSRSKKSTEFNSRERIH